MTNQEKGRYVLAAAVEAGAEIIMTLNLRDFPDEALAPHRVKARHPDRFLIELYGLSPQVVTHSQHAQATAIGRSLGQLLDTLSGITPDFIDLIRSQFEI